MKSCRIATGTAIQGNPDTSASSHRSRHDSRVGHTILIDTAEDRLISKFCAFFYICHHREGVYTHQQHPLHLVSFLLRPIWDTFCLLSFGFWDLWCKMQLKSYTRCGIFGVIPTNNMNAILQPFAAAVPLDIFSALLVNKAGLKLYEHTVSTYQLNLQNHGTR